MHPRQMTALTYCIDFATKARFLPQKTNEQMFKSLFLRPIEYVMAHLKPQKVRVTKQFSFDMAHALYGYNGPCKNIHGHTYHFEVTLLGFPIEDDQASQNGMVIDFSVLKLIVHQQIIARYDHALVLNENAPYVRSELLSSQFEKVYSVPFQPTCENLLLHFLEKITPLFPINTQLVSAVLRETPSSYAEWRLEDNL
jgi:6-pyruvoyltetrahydropterin/6-carboxytetrahydropterin synthase